MPAGVVFTRFEDPAINDAGQIAFRASAGGVGIWATDRAGILQRIIGSGDLLEVAPGDFRTVSGATFLGGNYFGRSSSGLNNLGQIAFYASFTGGFGIFVSNAVAVPEPACVLLLAIAAAPIFLSRRLYNMRLGVAIVACAVVPLGTDAATVRTVALTGQHAPGTQEGVNFRFFSYSNSHLSAEGPTLNSAGQSAFVAFLEGPDVDGVNYSGVWSEGPGSLTLIARSGDHPPGSPSDVVFAAGPDWTKLALSDHGRTAFLAVTVSGCCTLSRGIWAYRNGALELIVRQGDPVPSGGGVWGYPPYPQLNASGQTALLIDSPSTSIWSDRSGSLALIARSGDPAPGTAGKFALNYSSPAFNDAGHVAFAGNIGTGPPAIWSDRSGNLELAISADQVPGMPAGVAFKQMRGVLLNSSSEIAFWGVFAGPGATNGYGLWAERAGALRLIARSGDHAPGLPDGINFSPSIYSGGTPAFAFNDSGQAAFSAHLVGAGVDSSNNQSIWSEGAGDLRLVAHQGEHAPAPQTE